MWGSGLGQGRGVMEVDGVVPARFCTRSESPLLPPYILPAGRCEGGTMAGLGVARMRKRRDLRRKRAGEGAAQ